MAKKSAKPEQLEPAADASPGLDRATPETAAPAARRCPYHDDAELVPRHTPEVTVLECPHCTYMEKVINPRFQQALQRERLFAESQERERAAEIEREKLADEEPQADPDYFPGRR